MKNIMLALVCSVFFAGYAAKQVSKGYYETGELKYKPVVHLGRNNYLFD